MTTNPDSKLVQAALSGDAESFSRLCQRHYAALVAVAYCQLGDRDLAEDAAQEALLAAFRGISKLKCPDRFVPWLVTICRNIAIDMAKKRARRRLAGIENAAASDPGSDTDDVVETFRDIIGSLDPDGREVVYLKYYNQKTYGQIAITLGISSEAVNGRLRRAKEKIRQELRRRSALEIGP